MSLRYVEGTPEGWELTEDKVPLNQKGGSKAGDKDGNCAVM